MTDKDRSHPKMTIRDDGTDFNLAVIKNAFRWCADVPLLRRIKRDRCVLFEAILTLRNILRAIANIFSVGLNMIIYLRLQRRKYPY